MSDPWMGPFEGVIFDCDGVLVNSEPIANQVLAEYLTREVGFAITAEESHRRFTGMVFFQIEDLLRTDHDLDLPKGWVDLHFEALYVRYREELKAIPGTIELIDALDSAGIPWGVASQSAPDYLAFVLDLIGIGERARGRIASSKDVPNPKPAPDVYLLACRKVGCDPVRTAVVEDSPTGARAGVAAGCTVFGYAGDRPEAELVEAGAVKALQEMSALRPILTGR
ncbi:MAG: HAD family phosphatase [Alphaproteobacteria bacterium]|nr:HAD family phosphatase [Alphaproteobacteria bacterium]